MSFAHWTALSVVVLMLRSDMPAHIAIEGMRDFMVGALHPLYSPNHLLLLVAAGLSLGQFPELKVRTPLCVFAAVSAIGLAITMLQPNLEVPTALFSVIGLCVGAFVAASWRTPAWAYALLTGIIAVVIGLDSGVETGSRAVVLETLLGTWFSLLVCLITVTFYVALVTDKKRKWIDIAIRVVASWIVAISVLMLAFAFRRGPTG